MSEKDKYSVEDLELKNESFKCKVLDLSFNFSDRMAKGDMPSKEEIAERAMYKKLYDDTLKILRDMKKNNKYSLTPSLFEGLSKQLKNIELGLAPLQQNTK